LLLGFMVCIYMYISLLYWVIYFSLAFCERCYKNGGMEFW
jgi:hypothetical protein